MTARADAATRYSHGSQQQLILSKQAAVVLGVSVCASPIPRRNFHSESDHHHHQHRHRPPPTTTQDGAVAQIRRGRAIVQAGGIFTGAASAAADAAAANDLV
ncbi:unnamed protein product [Lampetra fluviatilis]